MRMSMAVKTIRQMHSCCDLQVLRESVCMHRLHNRQDTEPAEGCCGPEALRCKATLGKNVARCIIQCALQHSCKSLYRQMEGPQKVWEPLSRMPLRAHAMFQSILWQDPVHIAEERVLYILRLDSSSFPPLVRCIPACP